MAASIGPANQLELLQLRHHIINIILLLGSELFMILPELVVLSIELMLQTKNALTHFLENAFKLAILLSEIINVLMRHCPDLGSTLE